MRRRQQLRSSHLSLKALNQDGHEQIEEHVVAKRHEGNKVERRPGRGGGHAVIQNHVPVLLRKDLEVGRNTDRDWGINKKRGDETGQRRSDAGKNRVAQRDRVAQSCIIKKK